MTEPEFFVKRRFISFQYGDKKQTFTLDGDSPIVFKTFGWRSTGIKDKNDREIFEGDIVQVETFEKDTATVVFRGGAFWLGNYLLGDLPAIYYPTLEVVGHIAEEQQ